MSLKRELGIEDYNVIFQYDEFDEIHIVGMMGDVWCDDDSVELMGDADEPENCNRCCAACVAAVQREVELA